MYVTDKRILFEIFRQLVALPFQSCIEQQFNKNGVHVSKNGGLCYEFNFCLRTYFGEVEAAAADPDHCFRLVGLAGLAALFNNLFQSMDKKFVNKLWEVLKKVNYYLFLQI